MIELRRGDRVTGLELYALRDGQRLEMTGRIREADGFCCCEGVQCCYVTVGRETTALLVRATCELARLTLDEGEEP